MVNQKSNPDYGIIHQAFKAIAKRFKQWQKERENRKITTLIGQAEALRDLTGYRYYVVRFRGRMRVIAKSTFKEWIRRGVVKKGVTIAQIENTAIYVTKLKPAQPSQKLQQLQPLQPLIR